jgi:hypothetical protein
MAENYEAYPKTRRACHVQIRLAFGEIAEASRSRMTIRSPGTILLLVLLRVGASSPFTLSDNAVRLPGASFHGKHTSLTDRVTHSAGGSPCLILQFAARL